MRSDKLFEELSPPKGGLQKLELKLHNAEASEPKFHRHWWYIGALPTIVLFFTFFNQPTTTTELSLKIQQRMTQHAQVEPIIVLTDEGERGASLLIETNNTNVSFYWVE